MRCVVALLIAASLVPRDLTAEAGEADVQPPSPAPPRTIDVPLPGGGCRVRLPARFAKGQLLPAIVFLPDTERPGGWMEMWAETADRCGLIVAVPEPSKPDPVSGYPDITVLSLVRAAAAAGADPERVVVVAHRRAGPPLLQILVTCPRMARAVFLVEAAPARVPIDDKAAANMPALVFVTSNERIQKAALAFRGENSGLRTDIDGSCRTDGPFTAQLAAAVVARMFRDIAPGPSAAPAAGADDPAERARLLAEAERLRARGAEAGAYITMLRAARADRQSAEARLRLARLCLDGMRLVEAADWAEGVLELQPENVDAALCRAGALLRTGQAREAMRALDGRVGEAAAFRARIAARLAELDGAAPGRAWEAYFRSVERLRAGDFPAAAAEARAAAEAAPCDAACRALLAYAVAAAEGTAAARDALDDYLDLFPSDPYVTQLARALDAKTASGRSDPALPRQVRLDLPRPPPAGPAAGFLASLVTKAGWPRVPADTAERLAGPCAAGVRGALPFLVNEKIEFAVGSGSMADLRVKLAGSVPVLVQMPPGELAGLREGEMFSDGMLRVVVGYDDAGRVLLQDYGAAEPLPVPAGLFDLLWSRLDRWWLAMPERGRALPGDPGELTRLETATAMSDSGDPRGAAAAFRELLPRHPGRALLGLGVSEMKLGEYAAAAGHLSRLAKDRPDLAVQAELALSAIALCSPEVPQAERALRALDHLRRAWALDPGSERTVLTLAAALLASDPAARDEARRLLDDFLHFRPDSLAALYLYYSK